MFGKQLDWTYQGTHRVGDHIWWISDVRKFKCHYPNWDLTHDIGDILIEIFGVNYSRWFQQPVDS